MDADVMITIAFCLEVFLFAFAGGLFVAHEVRKSRSEAAAEEGRAPRARTADGAWLVAVREGRAVRGLRS
jgi:hypothetical protein